MTPEQYGFELRRSTYTQIKRLKVQYLQGVKPTYTEGQLSTYSGSIGPQDLSMQKFWCAQWSWNQCPMYNSNDCIVLKTMV